MFFDDDQLQNNQPQIPQKHITVIDSEALLDFDMAQERDRVLENYQIMLPDELRAQLKTFRKNMSTQEKEEFKHFMEEADRYLDNDTRHYSREATEHNVQFVQLSKNIKEQRALLATKRQQLGDNHPDVLTLEDTIQSLTNQANDAKRKFDTANEEYYRHRDRNKIDDQDLYQVQKEALYHQMKGNLGDTTLMGMHPTLAEFQQHHLQQMQMQPNPNRRIAMGFTEMATLMQQDPAVNGNGPVWDLDANGDMSFQKTEKDQQIQKMGFRPNQTQKVKRKKVLSKQVDPISENWRQDREALRKDPNHNVNLREVTKQKPYSLDIQ